MDNTITQKQFYLDVDFFGNEEKKCNAQFKSVSGLTVNIDIEQLLKNPEKEFKHSFPSRTRFPNLILKGGLLKDSKVIEWCKKAINQYQFSPTDLKVKLINGEKESVLAWNIIHAYPVKWTVKKQTEKENSLVIDSIELAYNYFKLV
ncbi:phage tail protein [Marixanthomonas ophiurae]|uniref:Glycerol acyltransferase n=1 Tax=Marixanthomonas ophiurae TaxID=387659 RepID=A0A3E1Q701_9FLAO|nr:phage tail protein [Marixanthomonas ophiurae]RFN57908.1 glycerol acyltransferase [Marixanthomonas ophiurae]